MTFRSVKFEIIIDNEWIDNLDLNFSDIENIDNHIEEFIIGYINKKTNNALKDLPYTDIRHIVHSIVIIE